MSIEEAWEMHVEAVQLAPRLETILRTARNLALVVLDELTAPDAGLCCPADAEFVAEIRAQIERLGKEGSE